MEDRETLGFGALPDEVAAELDEICDRFEADWRGGRQPRLEDYWGGVPEGLCRALLARELVALELHWRRRLEPANGDGPRGGDSGEVTTEVARSDPQPPPPAPSADFSMDGEPTTGIDPAERLVYRALEKALDPTQPTDGANGAGKSGAVGGRFLRVKHLAKGGLGDVYIARDQELRRDVALKEIQAQFADDAANQSRFLVEAEVTAHLEHPGIVPVYGLGHYDDGRPYYAMRYIHGDSLQAALIRFHQQTLDVKRRVFREKLRPLLVRFVDVCNAVGFAHSKGVVHRDLKPGNVMLGPYGETLVVDWGLAKVVGKAEPAGMADVEAAWTTSDRAPTQLGSALGTPSYMSPEQASGSIDRIGPPTDVYSLGATLYAILTGHSPYPGEDARAILARVKAGDHRRPRECNRLVPRPLEAVVARAMALRPEDRYASADALRMDVERWLADEPVSADREPRHEQLLRWGRHHRPAVLAGGMALVLVTATATAAALWTNEARLGERTARLTTERSLADLRVLADKLLFPGAKGSLRFPDNYLGSRRELVTLCVTVYESLRKEYPDDPGLREKMSQVYREAGNIARNEDRYDASYPSYERAIGMLYRLLEEYPENFNHRSRLAETLNDHAESLRAAGKPEEALPVYRKAIAIASQVVEDPNALRVDSRTTLATCYADYGAALVELGNTDEAVKAYRDSVGDFAPLGAELREPRFQGYRLQYALARADLADLLAGQGRAAEAEQGLDAARQDIESIPPEYAANDDTRYVLGKLRLGLGHLRARDASRLREAEADFLEAVRLTTLLVGHGPERDVYKAQLADALGGLSGARLDVDRISGPDPLGEPDGLRAVALVRGLLAKRPTHASYLGIAARALGNLARHALARGAAEEARPCLQAAVACQELACKARPDDQVEQARLRDARAALERLR